MRDRKDQQRTCLDDVEDPVRKAPHENAPDALMDLSVRFRLACRLVDRGLDARGQLVAKPGRCSSYHDHASTSSARASGRNVIGRLIADAAARP